MPGFDIAISSPAHLALMEVAADFSDLSDLGFAN